ncbi:hypothetical protein M408DRAFT_333405 [Serendipita vermifera MAFF 305830]|uniref:Large ribosomal subunit protein uL4m n=1 Tax=Serendipita vermifera MAFF 305830 TaxID=933852 RepID=A0A0C3ANE3_SERVB|nr:hypothetical protein M408DRAFT_333405 [Serendipita vermifera MAFF 305830]
MLSRQATTRHVCLTRMSRVALMRTAAASSRAKKQKDNGEGASKVIKVKGEVKPELVEPVIDWLLDDAAPMPFIPVTATRTTNTPSWLPMKAFCGPYTKDRLVYLDPTVFAQPIRRDILHACVTWYRDSIRTGTASTKTRSEVVGSGRKIRPQKGTGRARLGDRASPMLRGGGVAFGPKPRDFSSELPKKVREMGLRIALSQKVRERRLIVVPSVEWPNWKTKFVAAQLRGLCEKQERDCLVVTGHGGIPEKLDQATRNLKWVTCKTTEELQVWDVLRSSYTILSLDGLQWLQENLGRMDARPELSVPEELRAHSLNAPVEMPVAEEPEMNSSPSS